jgi:hypothetical protein
MLLFWICCGCHPQAIENDHVRKELGISDKQHEEAMRGNPLYRDNYYGTNYMLRMRDFERSVAKRVREPWFDQWCEEILSRYSTNYIQVRLDSEHVPKTVSSLYLPVGPSIYIAQSNIVMMEWVGSWGCWGVAHAADSSGIGNCVYTNKLAAHIYTYYTSEGGKQWRKTH